MLWFSWKDQIISRLSTHTSLTLKNMPCRICYFGSFFLCVEILSSGLLLATTAFIYGRYWHYLWTFYSILLWKFEKTSSSENGVWSKFRLFKKRTSPWEKSQSVFESGSINCHLENIEAKGDIFSCILNCSFELKTRKKCHKKAKKDPGQKSDPISNERNSGLILRLTFPGV